MFRGKDTAMHKGKTLRRGKDTHYDIQNSPWCKVVKTLTMLYTIEDAHIEIEGGEVASV